MRVEWGTPEILDRIAAKKTSAAMEAGYVGYRRSSPRACAEEVRRCGGGPAVWLRFLQPGPGKPFGPVRRRHRSGGCARGGFGGGVKGVSRRGREPASPPRSGPAAPVFCIFRLG